jgi:plastocyanin
MQSGRMIIRTLRVGLLLSLVAGATVFMSPPSQAAPVAVSARDNVFIPEEVRIDVGDRVVWTNQGSRVHQVTADDRSFRSENIPPGQSFDHRFTEEGYYFYFCRFHGAREGRGMSGVVIVGNPPPPDDGNGTKDDRKKIVVPDDYPTIQKAVDKAPRGALVLIKPGIYRESVTVASPFITIKGVDRFRTILHGNDKKANGIFVDAVDHVSVKNLTVRNYVGNGVFFNDVTGYVVDRVDSIKNRTYGIYAFDSYNGVIRNSFGWGSGDSAFYIGQCLGCSGLIENVVSKYNYIGYSGTNATGVVVRDSLFENNGVGVVPNTLPGEALGPNRGTLVYGNLIVNNNYDSVPAAGISESFGIPFGTGVWLLGVENNEVLQNTIRDHNSYGVLITQSIAPESFPINNRVLDNLIRQSDLDADGYGYDLAWDGTGEDNCFTGNDITGATGPPEIQTLYACANRPFAGIPYPPVQQHVAASLAGAQTRPQEEPPEPKRPKCQKGAPGCNR